MPIERCKFALALIALTIMPVVVDVAAHPAGSRVADALRVSLGNPVSPALSITGPGSRFAPATPERHLSVKRQMLQAKRK
jgi:hypothetical protein